MQSEKLKLYLWGKGNDHCLGLGNFQCDDRCEPVLLDSIDNPGWVQIRCCRSHTVALTINGQVYSWGSSWYCQLDQGVGSQRPMPTLVTALSEEVIIDVSCGFNYTAAVTKNGDLFTWGSGYAGRLGHGNYDNIFTPKKVEHLSGQIISQVSCGGEYIVAITSTGSTYIWGRHRALEVSANIPRLVISLYAKTIVFVSVGSSHTGCIDESGEVHTWGDGKKGRLGHGDEISQSKPVLLEALLGLEAKHISCGVNHTAVCLKDGKLFTFGHGEYGKLGHGDKMKQLSPKVVHALRGKVVTQAECGECHTLALISSGYVFSWGKGDNGQLGHGRHHKTLSIPCVVEGLREHNALKIATSSDHCAVVIDPKPSPVTEFNRNLLNNKQLSDVVFMVENQPIYARIDFLSMKSDYFAAMFRSNMREKIERVATFPDISKAMFLLLMEYLHCDGFTVMIRDAVELYHLADMYLLDYLKFPCMISLEKYLSRANALEILNEADGFGRTCLGLQKICEEFIRKDSTFFSMEDGAVEIFFKKKCKMDDKT